VTVEKMRVRLCLNYGLTRAANLGRSGSSSRGNVFPWAIDQPLQKDNTVTE
jgi:hypothetical protein